MDEINLTCEKVIEESGLIDNDDTTETLIFKITIQNVAIELRYDIWGVSGEKLKDFLAALKNNTKDKIELRPGSNQESGIMTDKGFTEFYFSGSGGDNSTDFQIKMPNSKCVAAFESII